MLSIILTLICQTTPTLPSIQRQIDLAPSGAVVLMPERHHPNEDLIIRRPVTLLGRGAGYDCSVGSITLDGPGDGLVRVAGTLVQRDVAGGGFSTVRLEDVLPQAVQLQAGGGYLELIRGGVREGVSAPGWDVLVRRCTVGGDVQAARTWANQVVSVSSGESIPIRDDIGASGGNPWRAHPGGHLTVRVSTPGPVAWLYMAVDTQPPGLMRGAYYGWNHLGAWQAVQAVAVDRVPFTTRIDMPPEPGLLGRTLSFQAFDPPGYYSSPDSVTIRW